MDRNIPVLYMYLDRTIQTVKDLLGSLIGQLIYHRFSTNRSAETRDLEPYMKSSLNQPLLKEIFDVLQLEIKKFQRVFLVVDGSNELEEQLREELDLQLKDLRSGNLSVMFTLRHMEMPSYIVVDCDVCEKQNLRIYHHCQICDQGNFDLCQDCMDGGKFCHDSLHVLSEPYSVVWIEMITPDQEIKQYVKSTIDISSQSEGRHPRLRDVRLARMLEQDEQLKELICTTIVQKAEGNFLIANVYLLALGQSRTLWEMETLMQKPFHALENRSVLDYQYEQIMEQIRAQPKNDWDLALKSLSWVLYSKRPLTFEELREAINSIALVPPQTLDASYNIAQLLLEAGDKSEEKLTYKLSKILSVTGGLIAVNDKHRVNFTHLIVREYVEAKVMEWFPAAEGNIAMAIMHYISTEALSYSRCKNDYEFEARQKRNPIFLYTAGYWGDHVRNVIHEPDVRAAALRFVRNPVNLAPCLQAQRYVAVHGPIEEGRRGVPNSLHLCATFGLATIIPDLLEDGIEIDVQESTYGLTALMYACEKGHAEAVRTLLDFGASVNILSFRGSSPMFEAISGGYTDVIELLIEKEELDINATYQNELHMTALMVAADKGALELVRCLLQRPDIEVNQKDIRGATALILAVEKGCDSIVSLLLEYGKIEVDASKDHGVPALMIAAREGFDGIVGQLLEHGADASILSGPYGFAAITSAVIGGHLSVVKTMVSHGADLYVLDKRGRSLLHHASIEGHSEIVQYLNGEGLTPDTQCNRGGTALHYAARGPRLNLVRMLLELGANASIMDQAGGTPLGVAWHNGQTKIARAIQGQAQSSDFEQEIPPEIASTLPMWSLAKLGKLDLVASKVSNATDLETKDPYTNDSAVHLAAAYHNNDILEMLLDVKASPDCQNDDGRTPLHLAILGENPRAVSLLLQHKARVDTSDMFGLNPVQSASQKTLDSGRSDFTTAIWLMDAGLRTSKDSKFRLRKNFIKPLFFAAVKAGNANVLEYLIDKGANVIDKDMDGYTAFQLAEKAGFDDITETLETRLELYKFQKRTGQLTEME